MPVPVADTHDVAGGQGRREAPARVLPSNGSFFDGLGAAKPEEANSASPGASVGAGAAGGAAVNGDGSGVARGGPGADTGVEAPTGQLSMQEGGGLGWR